jgi:hypothetical protein
MDNLTLNSAALDGTFDFSLGGINYTLGQYPHPEITEFHRAELRADGVAVIQRSFNWSDVQEDIYPIAIENAKRTLVAVNEYLAEKHSEDGGVELKNYDQQIADFFLNKIKLQGNQLVQI